MKWNLPGLTACVVTACALTVGAGVARAAPIAYTDFDAFNMALSALPVPSTTLDFEGVGLGTEIPDGGPEGGITFNYPAFSAFTTMAVTDGTQYGGSGPSDATSGSQFLGTVDADVFQSGDDFSLAFGPSHAIGFFMLTRDSVLDDDMTLSAGGGVASLLVADIEETLTDGSSVYFLGIVDAMSTFTTADVSSFPGGVFFFNIDDIVMAPASTFPPPQVSEPLAAWLMGAGLLGLLVRRRVGV